MNNPKALSRKINFLLIILGFCLVAPVHAQLNEWSKQPAVEIYYTPLKIKRNSTALGLTDEYYEKTTNLASSFSITQRIRVGAQFMAISHRVLREPVDRSFAGGVFAQYNFRAKKRLGIYLEAGYTFGNLCTCGDDQPFSADSLNHFFQFGLGVNYKITDQFHLKAGMMNYQPLSQNEDIYNWTQPFIGLKYHFYKKYQTPFKSRFRNTDNINVDRSSIWWTDDKIRKWNFGISSSGQILALDATNNNPLPLLYREFTITPRVNYWINQAVMIGAQGTFYHYENNYDTIPDGNGFGTGLQARFYPLSFKNPTEFRAIRIGKKGNWNIAPVVGVELRVANYSWLEPENAGQRWQYFDVQPHAGFVLAYKRWFNFFWSMGPTLGTDGSKNTTPANGLGIIGLEYNFTK